MSVRAAVSALWNGHALTFLLIPLDNLSQPLSSFIIHTHHHHHQHHHQRQHHHHHQQHPTTLPTTTTTTITTIITAPSSSSQAQDIGLLNSHDVDLSMQGTQSTVPSNDDIDFDQAFGEVPSESSLNLSAVIAFCVWAANSGAFFFSEHIGTLLAAREASVVAEFALSFMEPWQAFDRVSMHQWTKDCLQDATTYIGGVVYGIAYSAGASLSGVYIGEAVDSKTRHINHRSSRRRGDTRLHYRRTTNCESHAFVLAKIPTNGLKQRVVDFLGPAAPGSNEEKLLQLEISDLARQVRLFLEGLLMLQFDTVSLPPTYWTLPRSFGATETPYVHLNTQAPIQQRRPLPITYDFAPEGLLTRALLNGYSVTVRKNLAGQATCYICTGFSSTVALTFTKEHIAVLEDEMPLSALHRARRHECDANIVDWVAPDVLTPVKAIGGSSANMRLKYRDFRRSHYFTSTVYI